MLVPLQLLLVILDTRVTLEILVRHQPLLVIQDILAILATLEQLEQLVTRATQVTLAQHQQLLDQLAILATQGTLETQALLLQLLVQLVTLVIPVIRELLIIGRVPGQLLLYMLLMTVLKMMDRDIFVFLHIHPAMRLMNQEWELLGKHIGIY